MLVLALVMFDRCFLRTRHSLRCMLRDLSAYTAPAKEIRLTGKFKRLDPCISPIATSLCHL